MLRRCIGGSRGLKQRERIRVRRVMHLVQAGTRWRRDRDKVRVFFGARVIPKGDDGEEQWERRRKKEKLDLLS